MHPKPTIVIVPGAWHTPSHYGKLIKLLQASRYETISEKNPSCDASDGSTTTVDVDVSSIRNNILVPLINQGKDVVLVVHSYGGCPGGAAATGLSKGERTALNKIGGVIGLIYVAAFIAHEGESLLSKLPGQKFEPWMTIDV
jgi:hypothetical protein